MDTKCVFEAVTCALVAGRRVAWSCGLAVSAGWPLTLPTGIVLRAPAVHGVSSKVSMQLLLIKEAIIL